MIGYENPNQLSPPLWLSLKHLHQIQVIIEAGNEQAGRYEDFVRIFRGLPDEGMD